MVSNTVTKVEKGISNYRISLYGKVVYTTPYNGVGVAEQARSS
jgi:hypothetical protein